MHIPRSAKQIKIFCKQLITVCDSILEQVNAKEKREYSFTAVNKYLFLEEEGNGALKSMLKRSIGCVAFIKCDSIGL